MVEIPSNHLQKERIKLLKKYNDKKRVNIEVMEKLSLEEFDTLVNSLRKLKTFEFFVDAQFNINFP